MISRRGVRLLSLVTITLFAASPLVAQPTVSNRFEKWDDPRRIYQGTFIELERPDLKYGRLPDGFVDLDERPPSRGWIVDAQSLLRFVHKGRTGLIAYDGLLEDGGDPAKLGDATVSAMFQKTLDDEVSFGIAVRIVDAKNYYLARFSGDSRLELLKVVDGRETSLGGTTPVEGFAPRRPGTVTRERYQAGAWWEMTFTMSGDSLIVDLDGHTQNPGPQARLAVRDDTFTRGRVGFCCTPFAGAYNLFIAAPQKPEIKYTLKKVHAHNARKAEKRIDYPLVRPLTFSESHPGTDKQRTIWAPNGEHSQLPESWSLPPSKIAKRYDVIVAGAGCGGWAAAIQAARLGAKVLLLEETDWIGGQMSAAAVTSMDEDGVRGTYAVRERGLYREFHESMTAYYHGLNKDPLVAYYGWPEQMEGGYEPKVTRAMLYGFIEQARKQGAELDVVLRTRVKEVHKAGNRVTGVKLEIGIDGNAEEPRLESNVTCEVLIDATEYGDVIPLAGARYRVGNTLSDAVDPKSLVQDHTWLAVVQEYPGGVPEELQIRRPPPGYEDYSAKRYRKYQVDGPLIWGGAGKGIKGPRSWQAYFAWRGMADTESPLVGRLSAARHTQCGFNAGNDYPVTAATVEDAKQRLLDEREGIYRTLGTLYYFQHELGLPWSLATDEGFDTEYQRRHVEQLKLRDDLQALARHLPQHPYVRECRRIVGVKPLAAADLGRYEKAKLFPTSIALGDYFMDLDHGRTGHAIEADLDGGLTEATMPHGGGPFQVPLESLIPEKIDGFLAAEKNISQSRLVNGATRLQPITMLTGQAAGTLAALAVNQKLQPRDVEPREVQRELLAAGSTLIQRWYSDVRWRSELWQATQLLALYGVMDRPMQIDEKGHTPLGAEAKWGAEQRLQRGELHAAIRRLAELKGLKAPKLDGDAEEAMTRVHLHEALNRCHPPWGELLGEDTRSSDDVTAGEFALIAAQALLQSMDEDQN